MSRNIHIFYHFVDQDGCMSAYLLKYALENKILDIDYNEIILKGINYNWYIDSSIINTKDIVFFLDISGEQNEMKLIYKKIGRKRFFWIDHHDSIKNEHSELYSKNPKGNINFEHSAVENTYDFIMEYGNFNEQQEKYFNDIYNLVRLVGIYDSYRKEDIRDDEDWIEDIVSVTYALDSYDTDPNTYLGKKFWKENFEENSNIVDFIEELKDEGIVILEWHKNLFSNIIKAYSSIAFFEGMKCLVINQPLGSSLMFEQFIEKYGYNERYINNYKDVECFISYVRNLKQYKNGNEYSISCKVVNNSDINLNDKLEKYGYGGHDKAGGFKASDLKIIDNNLIITTREND